MQERLGTIVDAIAGKRLLVVGDFMLDIYWEGDANRISPEAPVPVVHVDWGRIRHMPGGAGNVVRNLQALGARCAVAGVVGDDEEAERLIHLPDWLGADASTLVRWPGRRTVHKARVIAQGQQVVRLDWEDASPLTDREAERVLAIASDTLGDVDGVVLSDYDKGNMSAALVRPLIKQAAAAGKPVIVDPKPANTRLFRGATLITPNESEAAEALGVQITDRGTLEDCGRELLEDLDLRAVLITRGRRGISLFERGRPARSIPAVAAEVYDVTGAGDTVTALVAAGLLAGADYAEATVLANLAASEVIRHIGCYAVSPQELKDAISQRGEYIRSIT